MMLRMMMRMRMVSVMQEGRSGWEGTEATHEVTGQGRDGVVGHIQGTHPLEDLDHINGMELHGLRLCSFSTMTLKYDLVEPLQSRSRCRWTSLMWSISSVR